MAPSSPLISCRNLTKSFASKELFSDLSFTIFEGGKIGLVGTNGAGKTTLLKILSGIEPQDSGDVICKNGLHIAYIPQHPKSTSHTVWDEIYRVAEESVLRINKDPETWTSIVVSRFGFSTNELTKETSTPVERLSGGWQKKVDIAKAFASAPDLYLFDEPTNHLDMESIEWLEQFIRKELDQYLIVSHDRSFLDAVSKSILEINPSFFNGHFEVEGSYTEYLIRRQEHMESLKKRSQGLASKVRAESNWLSRGPKARTTKAEARVRNALQNIDELQDLQSKLAVKKLSLEFQERECETRKLATLKNVAYRHSESSDTIFEEFDLTISPKMRLGIVGPNGCGKTTLLKMIAQETAPTQGTIKYAPGVKIVYFDQTRKMIPDTWTLEHALGNGREFVEFSGVQIHVRGWAKKFLFDPNRLSLPVSRLSGGEKARLHIAHLITQPADILVLDEPTNDLDIDTLEVLEECLHEFQGAVLLVCHDRTFLRNVTTSLVAFKSDIENEKKAYFYSDIEQWQKAMKAKPRGKARQAAQKESILPQKSSEKKLSYKEERELEQLEPTIEEKERELQELQAALEKVLITNPSDNVTPICQKIAGIEGEIIALWIRWEALEKKKNL
ncbi:MAG: ABC-F family ATP-binding cassette domain-containing protein [Chlamydia sp.]